MKKSSNSWSIGKLTEAINSDSFSISGNFTCGKKKQRKSWTWHIKNIFLKLKPHVVDLFTNAYAGNISQWRQKLLEIAFLLSYDFSRGIFLRFHKNFLNFQWELSTLFNENLLGCIKLDCGFEFLFAPLWNSLNYMTLTLAQSI